MNPNPTRRILTTTALAALLIAAAGLSGPHGPAGGGGGVAPPGGGAKGAAPKGGPKAPAKPAEEAPATQPDSQAPASQPAETPGRVYRRYMALVAAQDKDEMRKLYKVDWPAQEQLRDGWIDEDVEVEKLLVEVRKKFHEKGETAVVHAFGRYQTSELRKVRYTDDKRDHAQLLGPNDDIMAEMIKTEDGHWKIDLVTTYDKSTFGSIPGILQQSVKRQDYLKACQEEFKNGGAPTLEVFLAEIAKWSP